MTCRRCRSCHFRFVDVRLPHLHGAPGFAFQLHVNRRAGPRADGIQERRGSEVRLERSFLRVAESSFHEGAFEELCDARLAADEQTPQVGFGGALWSGDRGCRSGLRWMACSSALRADARPRFTGTKPGPPHGRPQDEARPSPPRAQQDPPGTRLRGRVAAWDRALACQGRRTCDCSRGFASFRLERSEFGEAAGVPRLRSCRAVLARFDPGCVGSVQSDSARDSPVEPAKHGA